MSNGYGLALFMFHLVRRLEAGLPQDYMNNKILISLFALAASSGLMQLSAQETPNQWYIGAGGGIHLSNLVYSNLDKDYFPENKTNLSGVFTLFGEFDFGRQNMFAIRPQISLLTRGGRLSQIGRNYYDGYFEDPANPEDLLKNVEYRMKATCFDIRVPLIWQIGRADWRIRPYIYVAPVFSVVNHGYISAMNEYADGGVEGYRYALSKANTAGCMFSGQFGLGAKYQFDLYGNNFFVGLEVNYEYTFTNTYGKGEKGGTADAISFFPGVNRVEGSRRFQGFEVQMTLGIPLSVFSKKKAKPAVVYDPVPVPELAEEVEEVEPDCYSLDEIIDLMSARQSVTGKKICAIDDEINFETGKSDIAPSSSEYLKKLAKVLKRTNAHICINGHTDNVGSPEFNNDLSRKRAIAVRDYLIKEGVANNKLTYRYYGMSRPIASNDTEEGRRKNRRVEFEIEN